MAKIIQLDETNAAKAKAAAIALQEELKRNRKILNADELVSLKNVRPRLEKQMPGDAYFFSIDGTLGGDRLQGALFGDSCMLVFAETLVKATKIAADGLQATVELLYQEYESRESREIREEIMSAGRRAVGPLPHSPKAVAQRNTLQVMINDAMKDVKASND